MLSFIIFRIRVRKSILLCEFDCNSVVMKSVRTLGRYTFKNNCSIFIAVMCQVIKCPLLQQVTPVVLLLVFSDLCIKRVAVLISYWLIL